MRSYRLKAIVCCVTMVSLVFSTGCETSRTLRTSCAPNNASVPSFEAAYLKPSEPKTSACCDDLSHLADTMSPESMTDYRSISYSPITLEECIRRALSDSEVFRDLGGAIVAQPGSIGTAVDPALQFTDPTVGEDAALSAFDANLRTGLFFENNDRPFNNRFSGDSNGLLSQDLGEFNFEISKLAATGTLFTSRSTINYDANNQAGNRYGSAYEAIIDNGFRHPLLQGSGSLFNRIAGPNQTPGSYNGILIARTNTEISQADFEESVRRFVSNVENAYWDLYYAYRELNAQTDARDAAFAVYKRTEANAEAQRISGLEKASAMEQYLRFESSIIESLEGRPIESTQVVNGTSGGTFRRTAGVRVAERRLRYLIGMPISDGTLLEPADRPVAAPLQFDWEQSIASALCSRPETRRQRWVIKQKELELTAAKNFLLPRLDLVGNYRFRGLGQNLTGGSVTLIDDINAEAAGLPADNSAAFSDLSSGNFQELQLGAELRMPIGFRQAQAGVRNAQLSVQRERAIMKEQERKIVLELSNAIAEVRRAYSAMEMAELRYNAAVEYRTQAAERVERSRAQHDVLLEAQRRILESQLQFINAEVEYGLAIKNVHYERATFLAYHGVAMSESESCPDAYSDYQRRIAQRGNLIDYVVRDATIAKGEAVRASNLNTMPAGTCAACGAGFDGCTCAGGFVEGTVTEEVIHQPREVITEGYSEVISPQVVPNAVESPQQMDPSDAVIPQSNTPETFSPPTPPESTLPPVVPMTPPQAAVPQAVSPQASVQQVTVQQSAEQPAPVQRAAVQHQLDVVTLPLAGGSNAAAAGEGSVPNIDPTTSMRRNAMTSATDLPAPSSLRMGDMQPVTVVQKSMTQPQRIVSQRSSGASVTASSRRPSEVQLTAIAPSQQAAATMLTDAAPQATTEPKPSAQSSATAAPIDFSLTQRTLTPTTSPQTQSTSEATVRTAATQSSRRR